MVLLGWDVLRPHNDLAAIRYPSAVRVSSIRVFPTGAQPFGRSPETVAVTEPSAFFVDVFFNASIQPSSNQDAQEKRTAKNALACTRIAYAGDATEFTVDMGPEYATRLIIFHGDFKVISVAIYGEVVTGYPEVQGYESRQLPVPISMSLSPGVDVANSANPTYLAEHLLSLLPVPPALPLVSRLIFSLKPENEDWDHPDFPYLYSDLDNDEVSDLESLVQSVTRPIRDDTSADDLSRFATKLHDYLGSNINKQQPSDDAYFTAKLLVKASSQQTRICLTLLQHIDLTQVFNEYSLDDSTLDFLLDAAANIEIARYFSEDADFFSTIKDLQANPKTDKTCAKTLKKLVSRIEGWQSFENALTNPNGDFVASALFLKDISAGEHSLGCWLECMLIHDNMTSKLQEVPVQGHAQSPPLLFQDRHPSVTHSQFIIFVKALLGISAVLATLSWSDSIGNGLCRERALGLLVLWQGVEGYREILNHCLLLRQLTKRLGWNKTDDTPTKSGNFAERLLVGLAKDPQSLLREHLVETILQLEPPFSFIESEELLEIGKLARVGRDGLLSAIEELTYTSVRPFSLRRLRVLRVSMAIITEEISYDNGDLHVVESFWDEKLQGIIPTLISVLVDVSDDVSHHFVLQPIPRMNQALCDLLFRTADDILHLLTQFLPVYHPTGRDLRQLSTSTADLYACSRVACERFTPSSTAYLASINMRRTCPQILRTLIDPHEADELHIQTSQNILRSLFHHASHFSGRDPVVHVLQVYDLIDAILPQPQASSWTTMVFPKILSDLRTFWDLLDTDIRADFMWRLEELDNAESGIGEWLLLEELKNLSAGLGEITRQDHFEDEGIRAVNLHGIYISISLIELLVSSSSSTSWTLSSLSTNTDISQLLDDCLVLILKANVYSSQLLQVVRQLATHANSFSPDVRFHILLHVLRNAQVDPSVEDSLDLVPGIIKSLPATSIDVELLRIEVGRMIAAYAEHTPTLNLHNAEMLLSTLEQLSEQAESKLTTLSSITMKAFRDLCNTLSAILPLEQQEVLTMIEGKFGFDEDQDFALPPTELPETLILPLQTLESILSQKPIEPSTPKRGAKTPDILGVVISPPTALLRSPAATGLTKTYINNDFRQLRQVPMTRLNTSRLPSTHVDDFEHATASPMGLLASVQIEPQGIMTYQGIIPGLSMSGL